MNWHGLEAGRRAGAAWLSACACIGLGAILSAPDAAAQFNYPPDAPWAQDPAVLEVLALRKRGIEAMTAGHISAETERYSSTFVANTPNGSVVPGTELLKLFANGTFGYAHVEQTIDYAGAHGPDLVVIMGEEIVVPAVGAANAGKRIRRRFTDVFRRENGEWRHDLRHANVVGMD